MIIDKIENYGKFFKYNGHFSEGFKFLIESNLENLDDGKYEISGEDVYLIISSYKTKKPEESNPEAHKVYADIQYMIKGSEKIGYDFLNGHNVFKDYDSEKDFMLYEKVNGSITLGEGMFAVFFPEDIHQPGLMINEPKNVKKAVVKVKL